jgi:hypothetical protein
MSISAYLIDILRVCSLKTQLDFLLPWGRGEEIVIGISGGKRSRYVKTNIDVSQDLKAASENSGWDGKDPLVTHALGRQRKLKIFPFAGKTPLASSAHY